MKPLRSLVVRACILALVLLSVGANVARADDQLTWREGASPQWLPEDPGLPD